MNLSLFGCCKNAKHCNYFVIIFACCHNVKQAVIRRHHLQVCDHDQCDDCYCSEGEAQISNQLRRNNLKNKKKIRSDSGHLDGQKLVELHLIDILFRRRKIFK